MALIRFAPIFASLALASAAHAQEPAAPAPAQQAPAEVVPPSPVEMPEIPFPAGATSTKAVIDVTAKIVIAADGSVSEVTIEQGAGEPYDSAVIEGVKKFRFTPATVGGQPVAVAVPYTHHFVVPRAPEPAAEQQTGPRRDAVLLGIVQERGTRATPPNVTVVATVAGAEYVATTDAQGHFRLELPAGDADVRVVDGLHKPFLQHEKLEAKQELKVRYLVDRASYGGFEATVVGARDRTEVSRTTLSGRELTKVPGTFGDPYRVVTVLPGVSTVMSLLPYPIVRGSSPGNTGLLLDGVRLPLLYHLFAGPAIIHPELIDRIEFFPGGFPVNYGGYTGGILDGLTRRTPNTEPRTEIDLGLTSAGVFLRRTSESLGITTTVAGRYGYPGLILSLVSPQVSLSYWDYQARVDGTALGGNWTVFAYGARDDLLAETTDAQGATTMQTVSMLQTHHVDLRWRTGNDERERSARLVLLDDESQTGPSTLTRTLGLQPMLRLRQPLAPSLVFDSGLDGSVRSLKTTRSESEQKALSALTDALEDSGTLLGGGAFAQLTWKPADKIVVLPGVRGDVVHDATNTRWSADPRLNVRYQLRGGEVGETWLKGSVGMYHQPPRLSLPLPGADEAKLTYELLASKQTSLGAEVRLSPGVDLDVATYYNANNPVLFDLSINRDATSLLNQPPTTAPGEQPPPITRTNTAEQVIKKMATPLSGRAYGLEIMLRKRDTNGFFGWLAYTLSHSERQKDGAWVPFDFDRTHILNAVAGVRLPHNWELGGRLLLQTGTPVTTIHGYNAGRTDPQLRVDVRVDKRAVWNEWLLDFYVDVINSTVAEESGGLVGTQAFKYVLPTIGFRAVL